MARKCQCIKETGIEGITLWHTYSFDTRMGAYMIMANETETTFEPIYYAPENFFEFFRIME